MLSTETLARELSDGLISKVYTQSELDQVRAKRTDLGGIPEFLESALEGKGLKVLMADMTPDALEVMGGSFYNAEAKTIIFNPGDKFYVGEDGSVHEIPICLVLYHELGHAHQHLVDGMDTQGGSRDSIEHDNIARFEWPMCDYAKLPRRKNYNLHWGLTEDAARTNSAKIYSGETPTTISKKLPAVKYLTY